MSADISDLDEGYLAESKGHTARAVLWATGTIALIFVVLRVYVRLHIRRIFGVDDGLVVVAMILLLAYCIAVTYATTIGLGRHLNAILATQPQDLEMISLLDVAAQPILLIACSLGKAAFAVTLLRLGVQRWIRFVCWFIIVSINLLHVMICILMFVRCEDPRVMWVPGVTSKCWPATAFMAFIVAVGVYGALVDFILALIPWFIIWGLHGMKMREKIGIGVAMSLGIFAGATAIVKTIYLVPYASIDDFTYKHVDLMWWAATECSLILVAASIPTLKPLLTSLKVIILGTGTEPSSNRSYPGQSNKNKTPTISRLTPKRRPGKWTAIYETELNTMPDRRDDQSDKGILETTEQVDGENLSDSNSGRGAAHSPPRIVVHGSSSRR